MSIISLSSLKKVIRNVDVSNDLNLDSFYMELSRACPILTDDDLIDVLDYLDDIGIISDNETVQLIDYEIEELCDFINSMY